MLAEITGINYSSIQFDTSKYVGALSKILDNKSSIDFSSKIHDAIKEVADSQSKANQITKDYELGKETDLTKVVMQQQVANIAFQLTLNVRNKVLSSYKDIMNMPV